jgi:predicted branched-subunit amino acid permease
VSGDGRRRAIVRDAIGISLATGAYALSFGALSVAAGLSLAQTCALSLLMFTGGSQFALVGIVGGGGAGAAAAATAVLLGTRNALYGLRMASVLRLPGLRRLPAAQFVIDETTAMALVQEDRDHARLAFWATGLILFTCWNAGTLIGGVAGEALSDPRALGLDAAPAAAYLALLRPLVQSRSAAAVALAAAGAALVSVPLVPAGVPVLVAAVVAAVLALVR